MEELFPLKMLHDIQRSVLSLEALADRLAVHPSTFWRLRTSLERGELPDKSVVIAVYWALGFDKSVLDAISQRYDVAKLVTPLRRETAKQRAVLKVDVSHVDTDALPRSQHKLANY